MLGSRCQKFAGIFEILFIFRCFIFLFFLCFFLSSFSLTYILYWVLILILYCFVHVYFCFTDSDFDVVVKASEIFQSIPLGKLLDSIEGTYIHDVLKAYLKDFIHMVYPVQSEEECSVSYHNLFKKTKY